MPAVKPAQVERPDPLAVAPATCAAPAAEPAGETRFGVAIEDPFRWLEDEGSPRVHQFVAAQDQQARDHLRALPGRQQLVDRLRALFYVDAISAPRRYGSHYFYSRTHADKEKAVLYVRQGRDGVERMLLDPNRLSADGSLSIGSWQPSPDGAVVVYAERANNGDEATLRILDVDCRSEVMPAGCRPDEVIPGAKYAYPSFTPDGSAFYYTYLPSTANGRPLSAAERPAFAEIRMHRLGESAADDMLVYPATRAATTFVQCDLSRDGRYLLLYLQHGWSACDVYFCDLQALPALPWGGPPEVLRAAFVPLRVGVAARYQVIPWQDRFYIFTNEDAPRGQVLIADPQDPARASWRALVPQDGGDGDHGAVITDVTVVGGALGVHALLRAHSVLRLYSLTATATATPGPAPPREVGLPGLGQSYGFIGNPEDDEFYYHYTSFTQPAQIFRSSVRDGGAELWAEVKLPIPRGADSPYVVEQVSYPSRDGTAVTMFLVGHRDRPRDGSTPLLLIGYGGFNISLLPEFSAGLLMFLEHGGAFAIANLRGGGEYGEAWHSAGMLAHKQNVFDDFLAAAEYLIAHRHTSPDRLAIRGGSNGGLLVGAALTQRPELFRAAICAVPLLDMLRYHLFGSGQTWIPEYGNPEDAADFQVLRAYSPYHHVSRRPYPAVLMLSADHDDRVDPMHARKMTALLQQRTTSDRPILLRVEQNAGHGGADLVRKTIDQAADAYAFLLSELGMS